MRPMCLVVQLEADHRAVKGRSQMRLNGKRFHMGARMGEHDTASHGYVHRVQETRHTIQLSKKADIAVY